MLSRALESILNITGMSAIFTALIAIAFKTPPAARATNCIQRLFVELFIIIAPPCKPALIGAELSGFLFGFLVQALPAPFTCHALQRGGSGTFVIDLNLITAAKGFHRVLGDAKKRGDLRIPRTLPPHQLYFFPLFNSHYIPPIRMGRCSLQRPVHFHYLSARNLFRHPETFHGLR